MNYVDLVTAKSSIEGVVDTPLTKADFLGNAQSLADMSKAAFAGVYEAVGQAAQHGIA